MTIIQEIVDHHGINGIDNRRGLCGRRSLVRSLLRLVASFFCWGIMIFMIRRTAVVLLLLRER